MKVLEDVKTSADLAAAYGGSAVWARRATRQERSKVL
jgi:hypothetical protein